jgi:hypothetical protein
VVVLLPRLLLLVLLLRLLVLAVWRWHRPAALLEGEADVVDVEGPLLERLLRELRLPVRVVVAEERQRLRHRDCWAVSSWWRTRETLIRCIADHKFPWGKISISFAALKGRGSSVPFVAFDVTEDSRSHLARVRGMLRRSCG